MKTLKRNGDFKRVKDSTMNDRKTIENMIESGWKYVSKKEWKESTRSPENVEQTEKPKKKKEKKEKGKK